MAISAVEGQHAELPLREWSVTGSRTQDLQATSQSKLLPCAALAAERSAGLGLRN